MRKQKNSTYLFLILGIIGAMMVCFFNIYQHTNRFNLLDPVPSASIFNTCRVICTLTIGAIICFGLTALCISIRFKQQYFISILYLLIGLLSVAYIQFTFSNYYEIKDIFAWNPINHGLKIAILLLLSLMIYTMFKLPIWVRITSLVVNGGFFIATLVFLIFAKSFTLPTRTIFYSTCEVYEVICMLGLVVTTFILVKKDIYYSLHVFCAMLAFACYPLADFIFCDVLTFKPCYLSFYEFGSLVLYLILGFTVLNFIVSSYDAEQRKLALDLEIEKNITKRREHYETFAEQLDNVKEIPEYTYSPILAVEALLLYYEKNAKMRHIDFQVNFDIPKEIKIKHGELCLVLANLLDNAIEACDKMKTGPKYIHLDANIVEHMMMLEIRNSYDGLPLVPCGDLFYTTKEYSTRGTGLTTSKDIATRYNGSLSLQAKADVPQPYFNAQMFFSRVAE